MPNTEKVVSKESVKPYIEKYEASTMILSVLTASGCWDCLKK